MNDQRGIQSVESLRDFHPEGNIVPMEWFSHVKFANGRTDFIAIMILSDIVYWHRPTQIRDEITGNVLEYRKKFKRDLLQKSYSHYASLFGLSKKQVTEAMTRLEERGLIQRVWRTIDTEELTLNNVLFIALDVEKVKQLQVRAIPPSSHGDILSSSTDTPSLPPRREGPPLHVETYTETTTNITTEKGDFSKIASPQEEFQEDQAKIQLSPLNSNWTSLGGAVAKIGQSAKGTSLDINWTLPDRWREWAIELGMMNEEIDLTEVNFRDYWLSKAKDRTKSDWFATWRVWCRKDRENRKLPINLKKSSLSSAPKEPERQTSQRVTGRFKRSDDPRIQKWHDLQAKLRDRVGVPNYESWFERDGNIELVKADDRAILKFSSHFYKEYIWKQFSSEIVQTLAEIDPKLGREENIQLIV